MKYIKFGDYDSVVIFPDIVQHNTFKHLNPKSAGFCQITRDEVKCYGGSVSLGLNSQEKDSLDATKQILGVDAMIRLMAKNKAHEK